MLTKRYHRILKKSIGLMCVCALLFSDSAVYAAPASSELESKTSELQDDIDTMNNELDTLSTKLEKTSARIKKKADEIAREQGKNVKTIQTQIYRARAMLRKIYEKERSL